MEANQEQTIVYKTDTPSSPRSIIIFRKNFAATNFKMLEKIFPEGKKQTEDFVFIWSKISESSSPSGKLIR